MIPSLANSEVKKYILLVIVKSVSSCLINHALLSPSSTNDSVRPIIIYNIVSASSSLYCLFPNVLINYYFCGIHRRRKVYEVSIYVLKKYSCNYVLIRTKDIGMLYMLLYSSFSKNCKNQLLLSSICKNGTPFPLYFKLL